MGSKFKKLKKTCAIVFAFDAGSVDTVSIGYGVPKFKKSLSP